jgi:hypothetical protein
MMCNYDLWETTETDGVEYESARGHQLRALMLKEWSDMFPQLTMARMRKDITERRKVIEKRNCVKAWMETLGIDPNEITTPEQALFAIFDRMHECEFPPSF